MQTWTDRLRTLVAWLGLAGGLAFAAALVWSLVDPVGVERVAREAIRIELQQRVDAGLDHLAGLGAPVAVDADGLAAIAGRLVGRERAQVEALRDRWRRQAPSEVEAMMAVMLTPDCGCRDRDGDRPRRVAATLDGMFAASVAAGEAAAARLEEGIREKYEEVAAQLLREFRIFTATNAVVLLLLAAAVRLRPRANAHLLPAAVVIACASAFVSHGYLFKQDWLHTIVFADYMGLWFVGYVVLAALLLADIVMNRARITAAVLNAVFGVLGAALSAC